MDYLADTVTIIRHFSKTGKIGKKAKAILNRIKIGRDRMIISVISLVEILYLSERNRIPINLEKLRQEIQFLDNYKIVDLSIEIVEVAKQVQGFELHDRLIVSTAKYLNIPVLTSDSEIINSRHVKIIWD
jgi:predicted nucleic acid-binding protein